MRIACLQMDCLEGDPETNREVVATAAREAAAAGARVLALPELWCSGYDLASATRSSVPGASHWEQDFDGLATLAREHGLGLLGGSLLEAAADGVHNCAVAYDPDGERARYRKLHLFGPLDEPAHLAPGHEPPVVFELCGVRCAVAICYDLRFPELFRPLARAGVELIHVPAQWPQSRIHHWRTLLVARAIECQAWVLGVNRLGAWSSSEKIVKFPGHSLLVDPTGEVVLDAEERPGLHYADVDPSLAQHWRDQFPILDDRRTDIYPE